MKFKAVRTVGSNITEGKVYHGSIILRSEVRENMRPAQSHDLKIVVYNDQGRWSEYSPSYFEPHED
jgi:hypothetical protein